ncbi:hypothetical protein G5B40_20495 [Pikeienuella piscinae]|uniref:DUF2946 domain-containing protein n=1 Tax=Pikeienuella piscinae TaxID=2748098 RepID=A0A7M3T6J0_9RHOB|nr:hypothetical protein [Pikeienuella piscinae]QIE57621.1 hypothetical protein G5B40_20495 [Pikeienuella piscinae]
MRPGFLPRLLLALLIGLTVGPRPALAAAGEVVCGLGVAAYDFETGRPASTPPQIGCDACLAAKSLIAPPAFRPPLRRATRAPAPRPAAAPPAPWRAVFAPRPRAPPFEA